MANEVISSRCLCHPMAKSQSPWVAHASLPHFDQIFGCISPCDRISSDKNRNKISITVPCPTWLYTFTTFWSKKRAFRFILLSISHTDWDVLPSPFQRVLASPVKNMVKKCQQFFFPSHCPIAYSRAQRWSIQRCDVRDCIKLWLIIYINGGQGFI